jgi:hypothetical protein
LAQVEPASGAAERAANAADNEGEALAALARWEILKKEWGPP